MVVDMAGLGVRRRGSGVGVGDGVQGSKFKVQSWGNEVWPPTLNLEP